MSGLAFEMVEAGVAGIVRSVREGRCSPVDVARAVSAGIERQESGKNSHNAFISYDSSLTVEAAERLNAALTAGEGPGPLAGVPVAVKDNICALGYPTTCASRMLEQYHSPYDATVIRRLREAGAIIVGKTNMDEFAMGCSTERSAFGPTSNPRDSSRVPGGSSGGSAAAVAAGLVPVALGSDTGGSVRQPAAFCGVVGIKPTYGRVSRYGLVSYASSLDQVGVIGRSVSDAAQVLEVISGPDPMDSTAAKQPVSIAAGLDGGSLDGMVIGVPEDLISMDLQPGIQELCTEALKCLEEAGACVRQVSLPHASYAIPTYYVLAAAEASSNLARYDGVHFGVRAPGATTVDGVYESSRSAGFGAEVKRRIMLGTFALSAGYHEQYYGKAQRVRGTITRDIFAVFQSGVDLMFSPTAPTVAPKLGEHDDDDPYRTYLSDRFTVLANLAGIPAISVPVGALDGLPVGGQLMAPRWEEAMMIRAALSLEAGLGGEGGA